MGRTAPLTSKRCILYIYSTNIGTEYSKHALYSPFFSLQNAVCFIMLTSLVTILFTFYIQDVLKLKKNNSGAKGLNNTLTESLPRLVFGSASKNDRQPMVRNHTGKLCFEKQSLCSSIYSPISVTHKMFITVFTGVRLWTRIWVTWYRPQNHILLLLCPIW